VRPVTRHHPGADTAPAATTYCGPRGALNGVPKFRRVLELIAEADRPAEAAPADASASSFVERGPV
jgi:hypothetical protein